MSAADQLLVVIDPVARRIDGESVRIAKDVLCAGAQAKICWPEGVEEFSRALARRGSRRPVVVGDDRALLRTVTLLQRERDVCGDVCASGLAIVPVGTAPLVELARSLGVPTGAVAAARAVLEGAPRRLDLLVDDSGGVVLGDLCIPAPPLEVRPAAPTVWGTCRSLVRTLVRAPAPLSVTHRLRVEADGVLLSDLDRPVVGVSVGVGGDVVVSRGVGVPGVRARARVVTVSGAVSGDGFRYRAGQVVAGPVRTRTWTAGTWTLTLPPP
ncbi:diacylglycerol kinase family protein [Streptomyces melanogenes]|uniref:diacylglycerol kinase n=1 Tax=Streptomyces melanogenes TaxID=67326 RepID=UPI00167EFA97|nr:diacylglycerol kinase [Streptomyces melanogenes]GGP34603.1 diacylglycerol kinase [Streptomyces melanogenes]